MAYVAVWGRFSIVYTIYGVCRGLGKVLYSLYHIWRICRGLGEGSRLPYMAYVAVWERFSIVYTIYGVCRGLGKVLVYNIWRMSPFWEGSIYHIWRMSRFGQGSRLPFMAHVAVHVLSLPSLYL